MIENNPGSQPTEIIEVLPFWEAASFTDLKYSGIFAWVSKLSTVWKMAASSGPCTGKSVAEPPQRITTSISFFKEAASDIFITLALAVLIWILSGFLLVKTVVNIISSFWAIAASTPRPILP